MTIRSRLLLLLLPTSIAFVVLIALFFYLNWSSEILDSFKSRLNSIVIATAQSVKPEKVEWINRHLHDPDLKNNPIYQKDRQKLVQLKQKLPILNLYIVRIEPVKEGDFVLSNDPDNPSNQAQAGQDNAYRQVILVDASQPKVEQALPPGEVDFSETEEHKVYFTKKALVTPVYEARKTHERFMSAYAPIISSQGEVLALLGADVSVKEIDQKLQNALLIISLGASITILLLIITVFFIADRISKPVQQLNQAALDIAAGNYEANIQAKGPREIAELANTLNTMSECLVENMSRLKESSLIRERMYGEYECTLLLQYYMLQKVVEELHNPHFIISSLSLNPSPNQKGVLLKWSEPSATGELTLIEAKEPGFAALYELSASSFVPLKELQNYSFIDCQFIDQFTAVRYTSKTLFPPLVWSNRDQQFVKGHDQVIPLQDQDMLFIYNSGLIEQFGSQEKIELLFSKVLRHFAEDGLDTIHTMLANELNFLTKKEHIKRNFHILGLQMHLKKVS